jgi:predicted ATPase/DNA-binding SARP family transcriptional activator/Tfp pilus assembly protein PilF
MAYLSISLLGTLQVTRDGKPITDFATDKARALLVYLDVESDRPHRRDALAGLLWPDQPQAKARQSLRQALSDLRKTIRDRDEAPFLLVSREALQFNSDCDHWLDAAELAHLVRECETHHHRRSETCLPCLWRMERMVELYRGPFLEQFFLSDSDAFEEWAVLKREWFQWRVAEALSLLAHFYERRGDHKQAQRYARRHVALEPWREEAHRQLMWLLALDGQRSAALAQYETCRRALDEELGVEPTAETQALYERLRAERLGDKDAEETTLLLPRTSALLHNLPSSSSALIGREEVLIELADLVANPDCRLLTLFGPGGIGKTRLALQVAAEHLGAFADGVAFISLAHVDAMESFVSAIASGLGLPFHGEQNPREQLLNYLRQKELLLVLDNVEHILECTGFISDALQHAPGLVLLATSRERLNLREEWVYDVEGLAYPPDEEMLESCAYSAIDLFCQHARRASQHFCLDQATLPHVARICRLVEGMPLAVELAAAWVGVRSCQEIAQEIAQGSAPLTTRLRNVPERHRSIRATFEYSWQLLSEPEQALLAQLSIFRGGFGREVAQTVAGATAAALSNLLDKSLVRQVAPDRYDMHQLLHQYTVEKLQSVPDAWEKAQTKHAQYFAAFLGHQQPRLKTAEQRQAIEEIGQEIENVSLAWNLALSRGWAEQVEQSLVGLYQFYSVRGRFREGIDLLEGAIERWRDDSQHEQIYGAALARQAALYAKLGHYDRTEMALDESLSIFRNLDVAVEQIFCLLHLLNVLTYRGEYDRAEAMASEALALSRQIGDRWSIARALDLTGMIRYRKGDVNQAEVLCEESLSISRQIGHHQLMLWSLNKLADIACHGGDFARAQRLYDECIALARALGDAYNEAIHLNNQGTILQVLKQYEAAEELFLASLAICRHIGDRTGEAIALSNLGKVAYDLSDYEQALAYCEDGLSIGRETGDQWVLMSCLTNLGRTACAIDDDEAARAYLAEALKIAYETQTSLVQTEILTCLGVLFAKRGQRTRAAEILALTSQHPASEQDVKQQALQLLDALDLTVPDHPPTSLDSLVADILAELSSEPSPGDFHRAT